MMSNSNVCFGDIAWTKWKNQSSHRNTTLMDNLGKCEFAPKFEPNPDLKDET